uniref:Putative secreted protein n=1 Tax=Ixodes ricinus TaxID=34613 RepID=A0A6B0U213_IXORI
MKVVLGLAVFVFGFLVRTYGITTTTKPRLGSYSSTTTTTPLIEAYGNTSTTPRSLTPSARMLMTTVPPEVDPSKFKEQNATRVSTFL